MLNGVRAQTSSQLFRQLHRQGYAAPQVDLVVRAHGLAARIFSGSLRASGKSLLAHEIGTASVLVELRAPETLIAAGLLHAAYAWGDFGTGLRGVCRENRALIERAVGEDVELRVLRYTDQPWDAAAILDLQAGFERSSEELREIALLRLANELDDWTDGEVAWTSNARGRTRGMKKVVPALVDLAARLEVPALGAALEQAVEASADLRVPPELQRTLRPERTPPICWSAGEREPVALSAEDIAFFKHNGYVVKRGVLAKEGMRCALDYMWARTPLRFDPEDWKTWTGIAHDFRGRIDLGVVHGRFKLRGLTRTERFLLDLLPADPLVVAMAEQLLGAGRIVPAETIRGLYATFPDPDPTSHRAYGHADAHPFNLAATGYLDDVEEKGGGFTVWPGSHITLARACGSYLENDRLPSFAAAEDEFNREHGLEITGRAGDVIFWHPRLLHAPGRNRSRRVRQAVLCDFRRDDLQQTKGLPATEDIWEYWEI